MFLREEGSELFLSRAAAEWARGRAKPAVFQHLGDERSLQILGDSPERFMPWRYVARVGNARLRFFCLAGPVGPQCGCHLDGRLCLDTHKLPRINGD